MNFIKKMCILRQLRSGFSGDGKQVGGVVKAEQYGENLSAEISVVGFAPLVAGEYYALLADSENRTELLPLRGKSLFNIITKLDISNGFCAVICLVKNGVTPLAYGVSGNKEYDFNRLLSTLSSNEKNDSQIAAAQADRATQTPKEAIPEEKKPIITNNKNGGYNDERIAENDYYSGEDNDECEKTVERDENASLATANAAKSREERQAASTNENAENVCAPLIEHGDEYYKSVKDEIDDLFKRNEKDETLKEAFPCSEWVKINEPDKAEYLVGVVYEEGVPLYICYAFPAEDREDPPEEIAQTCAFVPLSPFPNAKGCFVIFQSVATGECVKLKEA